MPQYTVFSFNSNDVLYGLFNAVAAMFGTNAFKGAIALVIVVGFSAALFGMVFARDRLYGPKWILAVILVNAVFMVPKATVQVIDVTGQQGPQIIDNVPWGLAAQASIVSSVGRALTTLFETAFQVIPRYSLSDNLSYSKNGLMFGAKLIKGSRQSTFNDPVFRANVVNFIKNCTLYDLGQGRINNQQFVNRNVDLWPAMANTNAARFSIYTDATGTDSFTCPTVYGRLDAQMGGNVDRLVEKFGLQMFPRARTDDGIVQPGLARGWIEASLPEAYARGRIGNAVASAATLLRQNALINAMGDASKLASQQANDPSAMMLGVAQAQAIAQLNAQALTKLTLAQEQLPLLRNAVEAIAYAAFPLVVLLAMMFGGMAALELLKQYALVLVWVSLWAPLYAVVNYLASMAGERNLAAAAFDQAANVGLTLSTANSIYSTSLSAVGSAADLMLAVPFIAGAVVFGMSKLLSAATGSTAAAAAAASAGATTASTGNLAQGNVDFDKIRLDAQRVAPTLESKTDVYGTASSDAYSGEYRYTTAMGSNAISLKTLDTMSSTASEASTRSLAAAQNQTRQADEAMTAAFNQARSAARSIASGTQAGTGLREGSTTSSGQQMAALDEITSNFAKETNISDEASARLALKGSLGVGSPAIIKAMLGADGQLVSDNKLTEATKNAQSALKKAGISSTDQVLRDFARSDEFRRYGQTNNESGNRVDSSLQQAQALRESASRSFNDSQQYALAATNARVLSQSGSYDWVRDFNKFINDKGLDPGKLSQPQLNDQLRAFLSSGEARFDYNGVPSILPYNGMGPSSKMTANTYADLSAETTQGPLVVSGRNVDANVVRGTQAANDAGVGARSTVNTRGLPTEAALTNSGNARSAYVDGKLVAGGEAARSEREALDAAQEKQLGTSSTSKLGAFGVTERVSQTVTGKGPVERAYDKPGSKTSSDSGQPPPPTRGLTPTE
jgi:conjugal transfer mating pair stabilization protein TraG